MTASIDVGKLNKLNGKVQIIELPWEIEIKDDSNYLRVWKNHVYLGKKVIGSSQNVSDEFFPFKEEFCTAVGKAFEIFASCLTPETASCSPSKMLHQLCSLSIGLALKAFVIFEEQIGSITPDLLLKKKDGDIIVDIGSNLKFKERNYNRFQKVILINKYDVFQKGECKMLDMLIDWSLANDKKDPDFIYNLILKQCQENTMLYSRKTIAFFMNKLPTANLHQHSLHAIEAFKAILSEQKDDVKLVEPSVVLQEELSDLIGTTKLSESQNTYYIFPSNKRIRFIEYEDKETVEIFDEYESIDGILSMKTLNIAKNKRQLFVKERTMLVHVKTYLNLLTYPVDKTEKSLFAKQTFLRVANYYHNLDKAWLVLNSQRFYEKLGIDPEGEKKDKIHRKHNNYKESTQWIEKTMGFNDCISDEEELDPDHIKFLKELGMSDVIKLLKVSRDYQELRMRSRIALAIVINKKPKKCFRVNHWKYLNLHALVKIEGLILEKDKGVAYVSYFCDGELYRTDKWRLSDVENYSVAHHRFVLTLSASKSVIGRTPKLFMMILYGRILSENSWGLSKFLKVYRYLSSGICMNSPHIKDTCRKLKETVDDSVKSKMSYKFIMFNLLSKSKDKSILYGKTPIFELDFHNLGFESFLVNLCPSNTYGKFSHLESTIKELADEIDLFNKCFNEIKKVYDDFELIISEKNHKNLTKRYYDHFDEQRRLCDITNSRFTFSPASVLLVKKVVPELRETVKIRELTSSCLPISSLMTAKASTYSKTGIPCMAIQSIKEVIDRYGVSSTSLATLRILNKLNEGGLIDLEMRMFDKDQVGGDREISILSGEYRIIQSVAERFFENLAKFTGVDKLHDPNKRRDLIKSYERSIKTPLSICLTADQTRWGPNFNTLIFGLIALLFTDWTTESFIPAIISFLCEFKVFEMPCWVLNVYQRSDYMYSLPGKLGRNHMGQGIHHQSSSFWHTMIVMLHRQILREEFDDINPDVKHIVFEYDGFITSDDLAAITYYTFKDHESIDKHYNELEAFLRKVEIHFKNIGKFLIHFGILTSKYKNIVSRSVEFNQDHLGNKRLASLDLKFVYSLIDPSTTGNFYHDFNMIFDNYVNALNSLCHPEVAKQISWMTMIKTCRQWKINCEMIPFPKESSLRAGQPKIININEPRDNEDPRYLKFETNLRYKTRKLLEERSNPKNIQESILNNSIKRMIGTRERSAYRSILTYSKKDSFMLISPYFQLNDNIGETYAVFMRQMMLDTSHLNSIINHNHQNTFMSYPDEKQAPESLIRFLLLRDPVNVKYNALEIAVSHYPKQNYLSNKIEEIYLHILRKHHTLIIEKELFNPETTDLVSALTTVEEKIKDLTLMSTACTMILSDGMPHSDKYTRYVYMLPKELQLIRHMFKFKYSIGLQTIQKRTYISDSQDILYLTEDTSKCTTIKMNGGNVLPFMKVETMEYEGISIASVKLMPISNILISEETYRTTFFINVTTKTKRLLHTTTQSRENVEIDPMEELERLNAMLEGGGLPIQQLGPIDFDSPEEEEEKIGKDGIPELKFDLESKIIEPISTFSCRIQRRYGFLCDAYWSLKIIIGYSILLKMISDGILVKMGKDEINPLKIWDNLIATVDPKFTDVFRRMLNESALTIRNQIKPLSRKYMIETIDHLIRGDINDSEIFDLLCERIPTITFTSEAKGKVLDSDEFIETLSNLD